MPIGFTILTAGINPPTPTIRFDVRWAVGARWNGCPLRKDFCMAQGDDIQFIGRAKDFTGGLQDLTGVDDIVFAIYASRGGAEIFRVSLSGGGISQGSVDEFFFSIRTADSADFARRSYWHETLIVNSEGWRNTVLNGTFKVEQTYIGALT